MQYALRSKNKNLVVHKKKKKISEKGRLTSAIMSCKPRIDYSQKWKVLYLLIDRSQILASHNNKLLYVWTRHVDLELTQFQNASYSLPVNLLSKDFEKTINKSRQKSKVEDDLE